MAQAFHDLTVAQIEPQGTDAVSVSFQLPADLAGAFAFHPGQYLTLEAEIAGKTVRRTYSICSPADGPGLRVGVRKVEDGQFSGYANDALAIGDTVRVMQPQGRFAVRIGGQHNYLMIAAGSGITPVLSMIATVLSQEPESFVTLLYGNRSTETVMFRDELDDLKDRYLGRFTLVHVLSRESQDSELLNGRLDADRIKMFAERGLINPSDVDDVFLCGPGEMIDDVSNGLAELGVAPEHVHFERFTPAADAPPPKAPSKAARDAAKDGVAIEVLIDGSRKGFTADDSQQSLVDIAHRSGIEIPHSCTGGMCCTCRCRILEGSAEMAVNYSLQPWEIEAGFTLACQARPTSKKLVLDFDAV